MLVTWSTYYPNMVVKGEGCANIKPKFWTLLHGVKRLKIKIRFIVWNSGKPGLRLNILSPWSWWSFISNQFISQFLMGTYIQHGSAHLALIASHPQLGTHLYSWVKRGTFVFTPCPMVLSPADKLAQPTTFRSSCALHSNQWATEEHFPDYL